MQAAALRQLLLTLLQLIGMVPLHMWQKSACLKAVHTYTDGGLAAPLNVYALPMVNMWDSQPKSHPAHGLG